jgi:F-type H+-transporting ATPase subunit O
MKVSRTRIASIIAEDSLKKGFSKSEARSIAAYLLDTRRTSELDSLLRDIRDTWAEHGFVEVTATCAHELSDKVRQDVTAEVRKLYPNAKRIEIVETLDPSVVGGVRIEFANRQLDLSIQNELNKFKTLAVNRKD